MEKEQPNQVQEKKKPMQQQEPTQLQELIQLEAQQPLMQVEDQLFKQLQHQEFMQFEEDLFTQLEEEHRKSPLNSELEFVQLPEEIFQEVPDQKFEELEQQQTSIELDQQQTWIQLEQPLPWIALEQYLPPMQSEHQKEPMQLLQQENCMQSLPKEYIKLEKQEPQSMKLKPRRKYMQSSENKGVKKHQLQQRKKLKQQESWKPPEQQFPERPKLEFTKLPEEIDRRKTEKTLFELEQLQRKQKEAFNLPEEEFMKFIQIQRLYFKLLGERRMDEFEQVQQELLRQKENLMERAIMQSAPQPVQSMQQQQQLFPKQPPIQSPGNQTQTETKQLKEQTTMYLHYQHQTKQQEFMPLEDHLSKQCQQLQQPPLNLPRDQKQTKTKQLEQDEFRKLEEELCTQMQQQTEPIKLPQTLFSESNAGVLDFDNPEEPKDDELLEHYKWVSELNAMVSNDFIPVSEFEKRYESE